MPTPRRIPSWLLIVATAAICAAAITLESANLFPIWRFAVQWSPEALPSSSAVPAVEVASGLPVLSLTLDEADLHDPATGLLPNKLKHGGEWEREGSVSYFEGGRLKFASGVGVRIHGGSSRQAAPRPGFRLYFRRQYGLREVPRGFCSARPRSRFGASSFTTTIGANGAWSGISSIRSRMTSRGEWGRLRPRPSRYASFVNGEYYGPFVLTERFDERFFAAHWGYDDILLSQEAMNKLWDWVLHTRPLTMDAVAQHVNIDNLTRWFLAVAFSATRDAYQGPGQFLDQTKSTGGWFWVNWDMDQSFRSWDLDSYLYLLERVGEGRRGRNPRGAAGAAPDTPPGRGYRVPRVLQANGPARAEPSGDGRVSDGALRTLSRRSDAVAGAAPRLSEASATVSRTAARVLPPDDRAVAQHGAESARVDCVSTAYHSRDRRRARRKRISWMVFSRSRADGRCAAGQSRRVLGPGVSTDALCSRLRR